MYDGERVEESDTDSADENQQANVSHQLPEHELKATDHSLMGE